MENKNEIVPKGYQENPVLLPIPPEKRLYGATTFTWMMFGMNTCIPMFFLGPIAFSLKLTPMQAAVGAFIGNLVAVIVVILNGYVGFASLYVCICFGHRFILFPHRRSGFIRHRGGVHRRPQATAHPAYNIFPARI